MGLFINRFRLQSAEIFDSDLIKADIGHKTALGGVAAMGAQGVLFAFNLARTVILARLLAPHDFGLIGMVTVVIAFTAMFKEAGLNMATVQRAEINNDQISTLFWLNVLISLGLGLCIVVSAPLVARFYDRPELTAVTMILAIPFVIQGLTIQHAALLKRHMRFGVLAIKQITAAAASLTVAIILALLGWRYWALIGGTFASAFATLMLTYFFCPWRPSRIKRDTGVRNMLRFGADVTGFNFVNYFSRNTDNILIGRFIGADALGVYRVAYQLFMFPIQQIRTPINRVAIPTLCALRDNHLRYRNYYRRIIFIVAAFSMPLVGFIIVFADNIIMASIGEQWMDAVVVFQLLAAAGFVQSATQAGRGLPLISMGLSRRYLYLGIVQAVATVLGISIGLQWGIAGVAAGYGIAFYILIPFTIPWCLKDSPVSSRDWFRAIYAPATITIIMTLILLSLRNILWSDVAPIDLTAFENIKIIIISGIIGVAIYTTGLLLLPASKSHLFKTFKNLRGIFRRKAQTNQP